MRDIAAGRNSWKADQQWDTSAWPFGLAPDRRENFDILSGRVDIITGFLGGPSTPAFTDVDTTHPHFDAVQEMADRGIVSGYPQADGTSLFKAENPVLRAQFAKVICGVMGLTATEDMNPPFTDLGADDPNNLYPHECVAAGAANNITKGTKPGSLSPHVSITRAQVITMVVRAVQNLQPGVLSSPPTGYVGALGNFSPTHATKAHWAEYNALLFRPAGVRVGPGSLADCFPRRGSPDSLQFARSPDRTHMAVLTALLPTGQSPYFRMFAKRRISSHDVLSALSLEHGIPEHIRSNNGPEFVAAALMAKAMPPYKNVLPSERLFGIMDQEEGPAA